MTKHFLMKRYTKIIEWNITAGNPIDVERARKLCQAEWQEFHEAKGVKRMYELADVFFTACWEHYCNGLAEGENFSTLNEATRLVIELGAWAYVDAVIQSNYTKLLSIHDYTTIQAGDEAVFVAERDKDRYSGVSYRREGEYYIIIDHNDKVLKPRQYKSVEYFLSLSMSN